MLIIESLWVGMLDVADRRRNIRHVMREAV